MFNIIENQREFVKNNIMKSFGVETDDLLEKGKWNVGDTKVYQGVTWEVGGFNAKGTPLWRKKKDQSSSGGSNAPSNKPAIKLSGSAVKLDYYDYLRKEIGKNEPGGVVKNWRLEIKFSNGEYDALAIKKLPSGREIRRHFKSTDGQHWKRTLPSNSEKYGTTSSQPSQSAQTAAPKTNDLSSNQATLPKSNTKSKSSEEDDLKNIVAKINKKFPNIDRELQTDVTIYNNHGLASTANDFLKIAGLSGKVEVKTDVKGFAEYKEFYLDGEYVTGFLKNSISVLAQQSLGLEFKYAIKDCMVKSWNKTHKKKINVSSLNF